ncbi:metallophosphoesterase [Diaphorobacter sp. HDW4A]|uniref:metallophosphoesterase n=1 Tax=Diaphorobacter sp. HDW4A TaxID=2714924 RepID=UPI00140AFB30|nr:metallophosphoesterase [Diaphorobacter sp. HDW4A]QIL82151.1 metallophosphoesterase [Diaphorobacter sp. HDW4A]
MIFYASLIVLPVALWLWWPLLMREKRGAFWLAFLVTALFGAMPAALIWAMRSATLDYGVIAHLQVAAGWIFCALALAFVLALLRDIAGLLLALVGGGMSPRARGLATGLCVVIALLVSGFGVTQALKLPEVHEQDIALPGLPAEFDGLRVAVIADIHASPINNARYVQGIVDRTLAARPDLIVLPGDMVDGDVATQAGNLAPLSQLRAKYGVFAAPGNHEYYSGYEAWARVFRAQHLNYLENQTQRVKIKGRTLAISGIGDPAYGRLSQQNADPSVPEGLPPDIAAVAKQAKGADFHLLLAHQPKLARENAAQGVGLQISGHTHGGHILGMDRWLVAPVNNGYVRGTYDVDRMKLFVSNGAGLWAGFAVRLGVPSRIEVLVLRKAP